MNKNLLYRSIPKVEVLLEREEIVEAIKTYGRTIVVDAIRLEMDELRKFIGTCESEENAMDAIGGLTASVCARAKKMLEPNMKKIINATGTILHNHLLPHFLQSGKAEVIRLFLPLSNMYCYLLPKQLYSLTQQLQQLRQLQTISSFRHLQL